MNTKLQTILPAILLLLTLFLNQSGAVAVGDVDGTSRTLGTTIIASPIGHANVIEDGGTIDTVRYLEGKEENNHRRKTRPFYHALLATLIVNVITIVGVLSLNPVDNHIHAPNETTQLYWNVGKSVINRVDNTNTATLLSDIFVPSYVCGTILSTTLFLVIPEAILFIQRGTSSDDKGEIEIMPGTIAAFGAAVMAGYMLPLLLGSPEHICTDECVSSDNQMTRAVHKRPPLPNKIVKIVEEKEKYDEENIGGSLATESKDTCDESTYNNGETNECSTLGENPTTSSISASGVGEFSDHPSKTNVSVTDVEAMPHKINSHMASTIFLGGATHNFFHGMFIGAAFMTCSNAIAVFIILITIYNKIIQQVADCFLLTKCAGISFARALLINFASGFFEVVGALVVVSSGLGDVAIGVILAFAAGVYLHISASDCLPRVYSVVKLSRDRWYSVLFFIIGALPIGLTLLKHGHCEA